MPIKKRKPSRKKSKGLTLKFALVGALLVLLSPFYYGYVLKISSSAWFLIHHPADDKNIPFTVSMYRIIKGK